MKYDKQFVDDLLLLGLLDLRDNGPEKPILGICQIAFQLAGVRSYLNAREEDTEIDLEQRLKDLFRKWPRFTGDYDYPVPHPHMLPMAAYCNAKEDEMWKRNYTYGRARRELLDHCIKELMG